MPIDRVKRDAAAGAVLGLLIVAFAFFVSAIVTTFHPELDNTWPLYMIALEFATPIPPISKAFECELGWPRDTIWMVVAIAGVAGFICLWLAFATRAGDFPIETNYYSCIGLIIVNLATLGAAVLLPTIRLPQAQIR